MEVRLCAPVFDELFKFTNNGVVGPMAVLGRLILHQLQGLNYSVIRETSIGVLTDHETQTYDGCIGSMQKNRSDIIPPLGLLTIPVMGPNMTHTVVDGFDRMGIISAYYRTNTSHTSPTHVLDMVLAFSPSLWILIGFAYAILLMLLTAAMRTNVMKEFDSENTVTAAGETWITAARKREKKRFAKQKGKRCMSQSGLNVVACILKQNSSCSACLVDFAPISIVYTMMTLLSFFAAYFLTSMIKTDMVVVKPPITVTNYDEILSSGRRPIWFNSLTDKAEFRNAAKGSKEAQIWERAVSMGINKSVVANNVDEYILHATQIASQHEVALATVKLFWASLSRTSCAFSRTRDFMGKVNCLYRHDASAKGSLRGNLQNHLLSGRVSTRINKRIQWSFEGSLSEVTLGRLDDVMADMNSNAHQYFSSIERCASNVVTIPHPVSEPVKPYHYVSLLALSAFLFLVCFTVLAKECGPMHRKKRLEATCPTRLLFFERRGSVSYQNGTQRPVSA